MEIRTYAPIWNQLKALPADVARAKGVSVTANRKLHPRIIKAVIKEKWMDLPYKIKLDPGHARMYHTSRGSILTFYLVQYQPAIAITAENV